MDFLFRLLIFGYLVCYFCPLLKVLAYFSIRDIQCPTIPENNRFDCHPAPNVNASECAKRGCCWGNVSLGNTMTAPHCYYPSNYPKYNVTSLKQSNRGYMLTLKLSANRPPPHADLKQLAVSINYETDTRLRFRIYDPAAARWEVPIELGQPDKNPPANRAYNAVVQQNPFGLKVLRKGDGAVLFDTISPQAPIHFTDQFLQISTKLSVMKGYGLGEHQAALLHDLTQWKVIGLWTRDTPLTLNSNLYGHHNFFLGLSDNGTAFGIFFLNSNAQEVVLQPLPALTYRTIGGVLDFFIFTGPSPGSVVQQYVELIGKPTFPPFWSLGFHLCRFGVKNIHDLRAINARNRNANIPFDVQWSDIDYADSTLDWTLDKVNYKELPQFVDELHNNYSMHYVILVDPVISNTRPGKYPAYDEGLKMGIFVNKSDGSGPIIGKGWRGNVLYADFSHPAAKEWWFRQASAFHKVVKFDGLWIDMNEPSNFVNGSIEGCPGDKYDHPPYIPGILDRSLISSTVCSSAKHYNSTLHYNIHSLFGYYQAIATNYALQKLISGKRPFIVSRSTFAGSGRYTFHWTGDDSSNWENMRFSISQILNYNLFGIPMIGADICGFRGDATEELCTRWMQLGAFYPYMRNHAEPGTRDQDPASWSPVALEAMRTALNSRYALLPYLYTLYYRTTVNATNVARPLFFEFPSDVATHGIDQQYLLGSSILVSPVLTNGARSVKAYFPEARWYDFNTGIELKEGRKKSLTLNAPLSEIVVHFRGGAIIPIATPSRTTAALRKMPFSLIACPNEAGLASGELFWDDGESSSSIMSQQYTLVKFSMDANRGILQSVPVHVGYREDKLKLFRVTVLGITKTPKKVLVNGVNTQFRYTPRDNIIFIHSFNATFLEKVVLTWT